MTEYAAWLKARQQGLGGTDIPAILGLSRWNTRLEVYHDKVDPIPDDIQRPDPHESQQGMRFWAAHRLEDIVADLFALETGYEVVTPEPFPQTGIFIGQADRIVYTPEATIPLEIKTTNQYFANEWGPSGSDEIPDHVLVQALFYGMRVMAPAVYVAVLIGGYEYRSYRIDRNEQLEKIIHDQGEAFWRDYVEPRVPPGADIEHPTMLSYLKRYYDDVDEGEVVDFPDDLLDIHLRKKEIAAEIRELKKQESMCQTQILAALGNARAGRFFDGSGYRAKMVERKGYTVAPSIRKDVRYVKSI